MDTYTNIIRLIIAEQEQVIGPLALIQAKKIPGLTVDGDQISFVGDGKLILEKLVFQYANFFGKASIELCKEAIDPILSTVKPEDLPNILSR